MKKLEQSHTFGCSVQFHDFIFLDLHGADSDEVNCDLVLCHSLVSKPSDHFTDFAKSSHNNSQMLIVIISVLLSFQVGNV